MTFRKNWPYSEPSMPLSFENAIREALKPLPGNIGPHPYIQVEHNPERAIIKTTVGSRNYIRTHLIKAGFNFKEHEYNPIAVPYGSFEFIVFPKEPQDEQYEYNRKLHGGPPIHSNTDVMREFETSNLKHKVCNYLKQKIEGEERESQQYAKLEQDVDKLGTYDITYNLANDMLNEGQRKEIQGLKKYYQDVCGGR